MHIFDEKVKIVGSPKIPLAKDAAKHKAGGGNVEIFNEKLDFAGKAQAKVPSARVSSSPNSRDGSRRGSLTNDDSLNKTVTDDDLNTSAA